MRCKFFAMRASRSSSNWESPTRVESGVWKVVDDILSSSSFFLCSCVCVLVSLCCLLFLRAVGVANCVAKRRGVGLFGGKKKIAGGNLFRVVSLEAHADAFLHACFFQRTHPPKQRE